jgi:hypothetical protein
VGLLFEENGYRFLLYRDGQWVEAEQESVLGPRLLPEEMELELFLEGLRVEFDPDAEKLLPQVMLLSSGETTPFELLITNGRRPDALLTMDALGNTELELET